VHTFFMFRSTIIITRRHFNCSICHYFQFASIYISSTMKLWFSVDYLAIRIARFAYYCL
jgi:hypothetical protein